MTISEARRLGEAHQISFIEQDRAPTASQNFSVKLNKVEIKENLEWEKIRYLSHMIYNTNVTKKSHLIEPKKLFPLPQDKMYKKEVVVPTKQDLENFEKQINKITKKTILKI